MAVTDAGGANSPGSKQLRPFVLLPTSIAVTRSVRTPRMRSVVSRAMFLCTFAKCVTHRM